jgi:hypothetical protein
MSLRGVRTLRGLAEGCGELGADLRRDGLQVNRPRVAGNDALAQRGELRQKARDVACLSERRTLMMLVIVKVVSRRQQRFTRR